MGNFTPQTSGRSVPAPQQATRPAGLKNQTVTKGPHTFTAKKAAPAVKGPTRMPNGTPVTANTSGPDLNNPLNES